MESRIDDWAAFYQQQVLDQIEIPATAGEDYGRNAVVVRDMLVDLDDVSVKIRDKGLNPISVSVYADVVRIKADFVVQGNALVIAARRIEVKAGADIILDYRQDQAGKLVVYTRQVAGTLRVKAATSSQAAPAMFDLSEPEALGVLVSCDDNVPTTSPLENFDNSGLELGKPMRMSLASIFQFATVLFYTQPEIAGSMLDWVIAMTSDSEAALDVHLQGLALMAQLNAANSAVTFVPYLDMDVYTAVADSWIEAAKAYEEQFERFNDREVEFQARKASAENMLQHYQDLVGFNDQLIRQADGNLSAARSAALQAQTSLEIQQSKVEQAGIGFKYDSKIWKRNQEIKAAFDIMIAVVEFAAAIGAAAVGIAAAPVTGGASAAAGGAALTAAGGAAASAATAAQAAGEVGQLAQTIAKLADAMKKIVAMAEAISKMYAAINKIVLISKNLSKGEKATGVEVPQADNVSAQAEWDVFRIEVDTLIKAAVDLAVPSALEYRSELEKLAVYGKAYMASQIAVIKAGQEVARLYLQKQVSANQEERLENYVGELSAEVAYDAQMMQMFFERNLNIKRWLFIALQNYTWAYRYWALRESRVQLSIVKPACEFPQDQGTINQEFAEALSFRGFGPPQPLRNTIISIPDTDQGQYKGVIANLRDNQETTFDIGLGDSAFEGLSRVRLNTVRVWLEGVTAFAEHPLYVNITNSGVYSDRLGGEGYRFASSALDRVFKYKGDIDDERGIVVDGQVEERLAYDYMQPTPFTQWTIKVLEEHNPDIDLSTLTALKLEFAGSAIGT